METKTKKKTTRRKTRKVTTNDVFFFRATPEMTKKIITLQKSEGHINRSETCRKIVKGYFDAN